MDGDGHKRVFQRLGYPNSNTNSNNKNQKVCFQWRAGNCSRRPCHYLHTELSSLPKQQHRMSNNNAPSSKRSVGFTDDHSKVPRRHTDYNNKWGRNQGGTMRSGGVVNKIDGVCNFWVQGNCKFGDACKFKHSWCIGPFSLLTQLQGHTKVISGISLPSGSDKLYTGSKDETVRVWDCQSGQCAGVTNIAGEVGCMLNEGPWIFVGLPNGVKAWNAQTATDLSLDAPGGQVYAFVVGNDLLFAGAQDGTIFAWKYNVATNSFEPAASLRGHSRAVVTLVVGANKVYSGSMDSTIRVWSLETLQCVQILTEHSSVVMSVLCWDQFLLSCSLDKTIKVWVAAENGNLEVTYTHSEEHGLLTLCGMHDAEAKPVLLCSSNDNLIRVYDLPSFSERGRIYSKQEVRSIQIGPGGLFFTGDGTGEVRVWKWLTEATSTA